MLLVGLSVVAEQRNWKEKGCFGQRESRRNLHVRFVRLLNISDQQQTRNDRG